MQTEAEVSSELGPGRGLRGVLTDHIPRGQLLRYVLVGGCNTAFSFGIYALLTHLFTRLTSFYPYEFASVMGSLISITVSFLGYKWFVYKTRGHYLREWMRATAVYTTSIVITTLALPLLVVTLRHWTRYPQAAPYIAGGIVTAASVTMSFFGHKHFSFRRKT